jgi:hypothetical protein
MHNPKKLVTQVKQDGKKQNKKHNVICVRHHYCFFPGLFGEVRVAHLFSFFVCPIVCLYVLYSVLCYLLRFPNENDFLISAYSNYFLNWINVREYRRGNHNWTIQRNWQHRVHRTKTNKTKTQHNVGRAYHYTKSKFARCNISF